MGVSVDSIDWQKNDSLTTLQSSKWAERGFCSKCGSGFVLPLDGRRQVPRHDLRLLGSLDDPSGITLTKEWFIDKKPDAYTLAGDRKKVTEAEVFAMFSGG